MRTILPRHVKLVPPQAKRVFKGIIFDVYQWQQKMFDGSEATFEMLKRPDTIKVLVVKDGKIVLINEEQPDHKPAIEMPGGRHDVPDETELECAQRELHEETGFVCKTWKLLDVQQYHHKIETMLYIYLATDFVRQDEPHLDAGEKISLQLVDYNECLRLSKTPEGKYLPRDLLEKAGSIDGLLALPEYH